MCQQVVDLFSIISKNGQIDLMRTQGTANTRPVFAQRTQRDKQRK